MAHSQTPHTSEAPPTEYSEGHGQSLLNHMYTGWMKSHVPSNFLKRVKKSSNVLQTGRKPHSILF